MIQKNIPEAYRAFKACGGTEKERLATVANATGFTSSEIKAISELYASKEGLMPYAGFCNQLPKTGPFFEYSVIVPVDKNRLFMALVKYYDPYPALDREITLDDVIQLDQIYGIPYSEYRDLTEFETSIQDLIDHMKNRIDLPALKSRKLELDVRQPAFKTESPEAEYFVNDLIFYGKTLFTSLFYDSAANNNNFHQCRYLAKQLWHWKRSHYMI